MEKKKGVQICLVNGLNSALPLNGKTAHLYGAIRGGNVKYCKKWNRRFDMEEARRFLLFVDYLPDEL